MKLTLSLIAALVISQPPGGSNSVQDIIFKHATSSMRRDLETADGITRV